MSKIEPLLQDSKVKHIQLCLWFELGSSIPFFMMITIKLSMPEWCMHSDAIGLLNIWISAITNVLSELIFRSLYDPESYRTKNRGYRF